MKNILKAYIDETEELETNIEEEVFIEPIANDVIEEDKNDTLKEDIKESVESKTSDLIKNKENETIIASKEVNPENKEAKIEFSNTDYTIDTLGNEDIIDVPKTDENLARIETERELNNIMEEEDDDNDTLKIGDDINLDITDINDLNQPVVLDPPIIDDIELLE